MRVSRADSTAWTSTVEHVHTTGFRWSCSSSATYCGGQGRGKHTGEAVQPGHLLLQVMRAPRPRLGRGPHPPSFRPQPAKARLTASQEEVGPDPREMGSGGNLGRPRTW